MADVINISEDGNTIHAIGDVEIAFGNQTLKAHSIKYNKLTDKIEATGPLTLAQGKNVVFSAEKAAAKKRACASSPCSKEGLPEHLGHHSSNA